MADNDQDGRIEDATLTVFELLKDFGADWYDTDTMVIDMDGIRSAIEFMSYSGHTYELTIRAGEMPDATPTM